MIHSFAMKAVGEILSCIWIEVTMFMCAAVVYLAFSTRKTPPGKVRTRQRPMPAATRCSSVGATKKDLTSMESDPAVQPIWEALRRGQLREAVVLLEQLSTDRRGGLLTAVVPRLLTLAAVEEDMHEATALVRDAVGFVRPKSLEAAILEAHHHKDAKLCVQLDAIGSILAVPKSQVAQTALAKTYILDKESLRRLLQESSNPLPQPLAKAMMHVCNVIKDQEFEAIVLQRAGLADRGTWRCSAGSEGRSAGMSASKQAANEASRREQVLAAIESIRGKSSTKDLFGAISIFEAQQVVGDNEGAQLLICIIQACAENGDFTMVKKYLSKAEALGVADMANLAAIIKGLITAGNEAAAESTLTEIAKKGLRVSQASYHGIMHSRVVAQNRRAAWRLVQEMQDAGYKPNAVTCSILLKIISSPAHANQLPRVLQMVQAMEMPSDDVLLCSMMQACLRAERLDLLAELSRRPLGDHPFSAPLYGSMIKAFGQARNMEQVWSLWKDMKARGVEPSAVTLGCMVEALVVNGETDEAWVLVQETWQKDHQRQLVNTVTYSSLLKGLANQPDKMMELYEEMKVRKVECNTITYNTILNCFAQCRTMRRVPQILEDMRNSNPPAAPDMVTYSTLVKGFCASGDLDTALGILQEMRKQGTFTPDEMLYNTLLSGCAREQRISDALRIVNEMRSTGIAPSNYTLSMLVKLLGRCKRLGQVFSIVEELTAEFGIRLNIQVYTCMIQACFHNRQPAKALTLLTDLLLTACARMKRPTWHWCGVSCR